MKNTEDEHGPITGIFFFPELQQITYDMVSEQLTTGIVFSRFNEFWRFTGWHYVPEVHNGRKMPEGCPDRVALFNKITPCYTEIVN